MGFVCEFDGLRSCCKWGVVGLGIFLLFGWNLLNSFLAGNRGANLYLI